jgi:hypothetical protein
MQMRELHGFDRGAPWRGVAPVVVIGVTGGLGLLERPVRQAPVEDPFHAASRPVLCPLHLTYLAGITSLFDHKSSLCSLRAPST